MSEKTATFAKSNSKVGAGNRVMLVIPTILTAVLLAPEIYSAAFSFTVKLWASAHFLVSKVMVTPMSTILRPLVASHLG